MCFSPGGWGAAPTVTPEHQSVYLRSQIPKATETGPSWLAVTHRWPERDQKAGACSGEEAGAHTVRTGSLLTKCPSAATARTSQPLSDYPLPYPTNGRDRDTPNQAAYSPRGRCLDIFSSGLGEAFLKAGRSPGLSLCQREASSLKPRGTGCWVPPWLPIILGHRHQAPQ